MPQILQCDVDGTNIEMGTEYFTLAPSFGPGVLICSAICLLRYTQKIIQDADEKAQAALADAQAAASDTAAQVDEANRAVDESAN